MAIRSSLEKVRHDIAAAAKNQTPPQLIAVSKLHPSEAIRDAYNAGQRYFGENYADELALKVKDLKDLKEICWIFIGQLQSNKIKKIVEHANEIQSIATQKHARYVERYAQEFGKTNFPVWIVVNAEEESSKQGVALADCHQLAAFITTRCPNLALQGLMAIPPATYHDPQPGIQITVPTLYLQLRELSRSLGAGRLSLGMSGDLRLAIAAGSNCVRIGTAIFGPRDQH